MPRFAPVCSLDMLQALDHYQVLGDYHLLLAHEVLKQPNEWKTFYRKQRSFLGSNPFVIMDNSLIELGRPLEAQQIAEAANIVDANVIVLPDVLRFYQDTVDASVTAYEQLKNLLPEGRELMGVVQGQTEQEYILCAEKLLTFAGCTYLAVPRVTVEVLGSRVFITSDIEERFGVQIHLLGFSDVIIDDICTVVTCPGCIGIDSSVPIRLGLEGIEMNTAKALTQSLAKRPKDWLECPSKYTLNQKAVKNVKRFRDIISVGK